MSNLKERIAVYLWHRFAPESHAEWDEERHQAEYRDAAEGVMIICSPAAAVDREWQPIETAPHDELLLLGWSAKWPEPHWETAVGLARCTSGGWWHGTATHWRHLPSPPSLSQIQKDQP
jgi:hypothetical protein